MNNYAKDLLLAEAERCDEDAADMRQHIAGLEQKLERAAQTLARVEKQAAAYREVADQ